MNTSEFNHLYKQASRLMLAITHWIAMVNNRGTFLRWIIVVTVSIFLGVVLLAVGYLPAEWGPLILAMVLGIFGMIIVGDVRRVLLALILLDIPFVLDMSFGYRSDVAKFGAIGGLNISVTTVSLALLYILWLGDLLTGEKPNLRPAFRLSLPLTLYVAIVLLSIVVARDVTLSVYEIFLLVQMFLLFFYIVSNVRSRKDVLFIVTLLMIGLVLESLVMIWLRFAGQSFSIAGFTSRVDVRKGFAGAYRLGGTIGSPNTAAAYFSLLLAPALSLLMTNLGRGYKWLGALAFALGLVSLVLTFSRGGWIAFLISVTILCFFAWLRGWFSITIPLIISIVMVLVALPFQDAILTRVLGDRGAALSRIPLMKPAFKMIEDYPLLGVGANNYVIILKEYAKAGFAGIRFYVVHNKYLLVWAETGIVGIMTFIWFLLVTLRRGWRSWNFLDHYLSPIALGFTAAIIGHMVHMLVDLFHSRSQVQLLWLIAGLITAMFATVIPLDKVDEREVNVGDH